MLENGKIECWVCKLELKDNSELKKHMSSILHKENAKTHCVYKRLKDPAEANKTKQAVFKVPEPKNSPSMGPRKISTGAEIAMSDIFASPNRKIPRRKSPSPSPVCEILAVLEAHLFCANGTLIKY